MRFWLPALIGWAVLIFILSSIPNPPGAQGSEWRSIVGHLVEYFVLAFLLAKVLELWRPGFGWPVIALWAWLFAVAYGITDEYHQSFVPRRQSSVFDVLVDAVGALGGISAWLTLGAQTQTAGDSKAAGRSPNRDSD